MADTRTPITSYPPGVTARITECQKEAGILASRYQLLKSETNPLKTVENRPELERIHSRHQELEREIKKLISMTVGSGTTAASENAIPQQEQVTGGGTINTGDTDTSVPNDKKRPSPNTANKRPTKKVKALSNSKPTVKDGGGDDLYDEDALDDVTIMAGIDVEEEEDSILPDELDGDGDDIEDLEEDLFCNFTELKYRVAAVARKNGLRNVSVEACVYLSICLQHRLRDMMECIVRNSHHRVGTYRACVKALRPTYNPQSQLRLQARVQMKNHERYLIRKNRTFDVTATTTHDLVETATNMRAPIFDQTTHVANSQYGSGSSIEPSTTQHQKSTGVDNMEEEKGDRNQNSGSGEEKTCTSSQSERTIKLCDVVEFLESNAELRNSKLLYASYFKESLVERNEGEDELRTSNGINES
eukprot:CFRG6884T1